MGNVPSDRTASKLMKRGFEMRDILSMVAVVLPLVGIAVAIHRATGVEYPWVFLSIIVPVLFGAGCLARYRERALRAAAKRCKKKRRAKKRRRLDRVAAGGDD